MNVVAPLCFASHKLLRAMYWTFHVLRLSYGLVSGSTLDFALLCHSLVYFVVRDSTGGVVLCSTEKYLIARQNFLVLCRTE